MVGEVDFINKSKPRPALTVGDQAFGVDEANKFTNFEFMFHFVYPFVSPMVAYNLKSFNVKRLLPGLPPIH